MENENYLYYSLEEKESVNVGFAKSSFSQHKGINGLKYYLVIMYIRQHFDPFGRIVMSISDLMDECGYSTKSHNVSAYDSFRQIMKELIDTGYIVDINCDISTVNPNKFFKAQLSIQKNLFFIDGTSPFVLLNAKEYETITQSKSTVNKSILIGVYLYIKQFIPVECDKNESLPKISYPPKKSIMNQLGISSSRTIESAIQDLVLLEMLYIGRNFYIEDVYEPGRFVPTRNIFALKKEYICDDVCISQLESIYHTKVYKGIGIPPEQRKFLKREKSDL